MRTAQIDGSSNVVNVIEAAEDFALAGFTLIASATAQVGDVYDELGGSFSPPAAPLSDRRQAVCDAIDAIRDALFARGCPYLTKRIQVDDSSRANIASMVLTAVLAGNGTIPWPDSISVGWISLDNSRIPLAAPSDGIALGATVGGWYATARQNSRTLKDSVLVSSDPESIDITTGWPAG